MVGLLCSMGGVDDLPRGHDYIHTRKCCIFVWEVTLTLTRFPFAELLSCVGPNGKTSYRSTLKRLKR